jgi:hypothetical protein
MDEQTLAKLAAIALILKTATAAGFILAGGIKEIASFLGHDMTPAQQDAIELAIQIDAQTRLRERERMIG